MTLPSYSELLRDPRWKAKRSAVLERDGFQCVYCFARHSLQVHHTKYRKNRYPWEYRCGLSEDPARHEYDLITLCDSCHEAEHEHLNKINMVDLRQSSGFVKLDKLIYGIISSLDIVGD